MTAVMTEPTLTGNSGDEDDLIHVICECYPRTVTGALLALCGVTVEDDPLEGDASIGLDCIVCNDLEATRGACRSCKQ